jgi:hypothetical protein
MAKTQRKTVAVEQQHIEGGIASDSHYCTIAEAVKDAMPFAQRVSVDLATIRYTDRDTGKRYIFLTPVKCQEYLLMLDNGLRERLKPFKFMLNRPTQIINPRAKRGKVAVTKSKTHAPIKRDGKALPMGPLAGGALGGVGKPEDLRTGRIRRYGLRSMGQVR